MRAGVHITHCCRRHGCKYGDRRCPVAAGTRRQSDPCEECGSDPVPFALWKGNRLCLPRWRAVVSKGQGRRKWRWSLYSLPKGWKPGQPGELHSMGQLRSREDARRLAEQVLDLADPGWQNQEE